MILVYNDDYNKTLKCLKKRPECQKRLEEILEFIQNSSDFDELKINPIRTIYDFEPLKYDMVGFYSFTLEPGKRGTIRLIVKPDKEDKKRIFLHYVSSNHYKDFKKIK